MKSLRRSLGDKKDSHNSSSSSHASSPSASSPTFGQTPSLSKPTASIAPPKKVIKARENHTSSSPQELPFVKGEFFFVVGEKADPRGGPGYYEALNTITNARGLVPKAKFEEFGRGGTKENGGRSPTASSVSSPTGSAGPQRASGPPKPSLLYAVVQYDFIAERPDELEAYAGENIVITAQSNHEWLVAKPIARTGGPGLIPISFVEIRDPLTQQPVADVQAVLRAGGIPKVEEWKQQTAKYKKESIPLGRFEFDSPGGVANSPYARPNSEAQQQQQQNRSFQPSHAPSHSHSQSYASQQRQSQASSVHPLQNDNRPSHRVNPSTSSSVASSASAAPALLPPGTISSASVVSFHSEADEFLFRIHANFLPHDSSQPSLRLIIFRLYDDFYHFQIDLLDTFRLEAGRAINPSDPSPDTESRILPFMPGPLDFIDNAICSQRTKDLDVYMRQLVALHRRQAGYVLEHDLVRGFFAPRNGDMAKESPREEVEDELRKEQSLPPMEDDDDDPDATLQNGGRGGGNGLENAMDSMGINNNDPRTSYSSSISASNNNGARPPSTSTHTTNDSSRPSSANHDDTYRPSTATTSSSSSWGHNTTSRISASTPLSASLNSSSQSHSASHSSTGGASAAFKKIKIFDRATDDLIAIRVPTNVTYDQLKEKVQDRLGGGVRTLKYRDSMAGPNSGGMQLIEDDESLEEWLRKEDKLDKLMLYAD